jgi:hypothetical protein
LHNAHKVDRNELQKQLSENYNNFITISDVYFRDANKKKNYYPIDWICDKYNVIVAGDFNDKGLNYWSKLKPFNDKPFYDSNKEISIKFKDLVVKTDVQPPRTCCKQEKEDKQVYYGDYILVNDSLTIIKSNYIPEAAKALFPASDHYPVSITLKETDPASSPFVKVTKYIYAFDIDNTLYKQHKHKVTFSKDSQSAEFRTAIIAKMKKVIESENYVWIVTASKYTQEDFVNTYFNTDDREIFNISQYFYFMNSEIIETVYENAKHLFRALFKGKEMDELDLNGQTIHTKGLKPYAIYAESLQIMNDYNVLNKLQISNFKIFLFDDNDKPSLRENCNVFNITFILVTDFSSPKEKKEPNLLKEFEKLLEHQEHETQAPRQASAQDQASAPTQDKASTLTQASALTQAPTHDEAAVQRLEERGVETPDQVQQQQQVQQVQQVQQQQQQQQQVQEQREGEEAEEEQTPTIEMKQESSSGSMFAIPLLAMVCAVPFIFLLSK